MVFQLFALYPHMNVRRNIAYPLRNDGHAAEPRSRRRVEEAARILRIEHLLDKSVSGLSGGDRQRVALGRAIVREPKAFMMDEPLGALDAEFRHVMCGELRALHDRLKATTVYVTHDQLEAMAMADTIAVMNRRRHRATCAAAGDLRPAGFHVRCRLHRLAADEFLPLPRQVFGQGDRRVAAGDADCDACSCARIAPRASWCSACGRSTSSFATHAPLRGEVFGTEYLGTTQIVTLTRRQATLKARLPADIASDRARRRPRLQAASSCRCSTPRAVGRIRTALHEVAAAWLRHASTGSPSASAAAAAVAELVAHRRRRRVRRAARADRRRQDDDPAPRCRAGDARRRAGLHRRARCHPRATGGARRRLRVPAVLALSAPHRSSTTWRSRCARRRAAMPEAESTAPCARVARLLHIEDKLASRATQLSGGQMQRVAIGRALVRRPPIYLMDEPLSSLDAKLRAELRVELKRIQRELGATILYVTHDQTEAMTMATRIGVLESGPAGADRHAARDLRGPGQHLRRDAARQPRHQSAAARAVS